MIWHFIEYPRLLRNDNLNLNSDSTRICSAHWDGGEKRSRTHLPSFFPWSKKKTWTTNSIQVRGNFEFKSQEKRRWHFSYRNGRWGWLSKWSVSWADWRGHSKHNSVSPTLSFCDADTQTEITGEFFDRLEFELKSTDEEKDKLGKKKSSWLEIPRDFSMHRWKIRSLTFPNIRMKILNLHWPSTLGCTCAFLRYVTWQGSELKLWLLCEEKHQSWVKARTTQINEYI